MRVQPWLLTGSSLVLLALAPISAARAQDATNPALVAAFQAYQQSQDDTTKQNLQAACVAAGFQGIDDCVSALTGVAPVQEAPPPPPPSSEEAPPPPAPSEEAPPPPPPSSEAAPPPPSSEEAPPPAPSSEQAPPPPPPSSEEAAPPAAPPVSSEEAAPPAPSSEQAPAPEAPSSEQTPAPAPSSQQAAPPAPSSEQAPAPVATSSEQASPLAALQGAVAAYNAGVDKLAAGDASGQADVDQAKAQIDQICTTGGFADTNACLAQFNLALKPLPAAPAQPSAEPQPAAPSSEQQPAAPSSEQQPAAPSSEAPPAPPASSEQPISEMPQASEPVDPSAVEVLPDSFGIQDAAPILDSVKDADNASSSEQPAQPAAPPAPPPQDDQQAQQDIQPPPQQDQSTQTDKPQKTLDADNFSLLPAAPPDSGIKVVDFGPKPNGPGPKPNGPKPNQPNQPNPPPGPPQGVIFQIGINIVINNPEQERDRFYDPRQDKISYEQLSRGRVRETIIRRDGSRVVTIRDKYGDVLQRSKILPNGKEIVLATYDPRDEDINNWRDPGDDLPPLRLTIPADQYILDADTADDDNVYTFFDQPPVEKVKRIYTIDEVKRSARLRDSVRRLEVGNLTFDTGKATISRDQVGTLQSVADAMLKMLGRNPGEVFLIEGHTDAVGSDVANLVLSDQRAATVARILTDFYGIPPENLVTQGYGERFLKVKTDLAEPINRRVTFKRITPLISYASN